MPTLKSNDVLIIGGGIIGLLSAHELTQAGASVTLIDKSKIGTESSWAGGGILSPLYPWRYATPITVLANWGKTYYQELAQTFQTQTGIDPQWTQNGLLILDTLGLEEHNSAREWASTTQNSLSLLANKDLNVCEPALNPEFTQGIQLPDIAQIRNPRLIKALTASLLAAGVNLVEETEVTNMRIKNNRITSVITREKNYAAENIVVAGGAWSTALLAKINIAIDVKPIRGQMLLIDAKPDLVCNIILYNDQYIIPRRDGLILVGSTLEDVGFDKSTTELAKQSLWQTATQLVPAICAFPIKHHWAGLRPGSSQGIPIISTHPDISNLYINAGHFRYGVTLGPASARLLTNIMCRDQPIVDPKPYAFAHHTNSFGLAY